MNRSAPLRVAWFAGHASTDDALGDPSRDAHHEIAALTAALAPAVEIQHVDAARAHDCVWRTYRDPVDTCVFVLRDDPADAFLWPYLVHYPGVLVLRARSLRHSRAAALVAERRSGDLRRERAFGGPALLRAPLMASKLVVVHDDRMAEELRAAWPALDVRVMPRAVRASRATETPRHRVDASGEAVPVGLAPRAADHDTTDVGRDPRSGPGTTSTTEPRRSAAPGQSDESATGDPTGSAGQTRPLRVAVLDSDPDVVERAAARARAIGAAVEIIDVRDPRPDVVVALEWPPTGGVPVAALQAMADGVTTIAFETEATAVWPALDPQTWQPRTHAAADPPVAITIDPRDEEHSLMLAFRRLAADRGLVTTLGDAAARWTMVRASIDVAAAAWRDLLFEAAARPAPTRPADWPSHLTADGSERARALLAEVGATVDFL